MGELGSLSQNPLQEVVVTNSKSSDVEDNKCAISELIINHKPAVEKDLNPDIKQSNTQNIPTSLNPHISDEVSVIGRNIIGHHATKVYLHNAHDEVNMMCYELLN
ncbi:hypothetical protein CHS0354_008293 [Potamilus streckersoni]|uniref:Uncharacterized protein n=1 Tax=Potamilus streckersoni TaxID=2493646 RepID=A0AAE0RQW3_9BIVA|nr:hypothetical protein CHS0354_008293 [Potamilus streckersoni]